MQGGIVLMRRSRVFISMVLGLGLTLALLWIMRGAFSVALAESEPAFTLPSLARQHAPVVITGGLLANLIGSPVDEIFVYAYQGTTATQIPFQIDERNGEGMYVPVEDGQLDDNDELVFMAMDGGSQVDNPSLDVGDTSITPTYVITLTDPISDTRAWTYVFCSAALSRTFTADYVSYDGGNDRITGPGRYAVGFNATHAFRDFLTLGNSDLDLLDRDKLRVTGTATIPPFPPVPFSADEQDVAKSAVHALDGPVRVTRVSTNTFIMPDGPVRVTTNLFAYQSLVVQPTMVVIPGDPIQCAYYRTSIDWNARALGMTYYDANNPAGVTVDGIPDVITVTPPTRWTQVAGITGTLINVSEIPAGFGGGQSTYYKDNSAVDSDDTGDQLSYGDAGFQAEDLNSRIYKILMHTYFLTGTTANVGPTYVDYYDQPLQASVAVFTPAPAWISVVAVEDAAYIYPGETATYTLWLTASKGLAEAVVLSLQGAPSATSVSFQPNPVIPPGSSELYITTTASTAVGTYAMTVTGTSGVLTDTANLTLVMDYRKTYLPIILK
jgi:hypothetical protein